MFNDILGKEPERIEEDKDELIKSLRYNVREKQKIIEQLIDEVTELERQLEDQNNDTCVGI